MRGIGISCAGNKPTGEYSRNGLDWSARFPQLVEAATPIRIDYLDVGGHQTERVIEPHHVVLGPNGSYVTGWCRLRQDERVFRIDRIDSVEVVPGQFEQPVREFGVEDYETRTAGWE